MDAPKEEQAETQAAQVETAPEAPKAKSAEDVRADKQAEEIAEKNRIAKALNPNLK